MKRAFYFLFEAVATVLTLAYYLLLTPVFLMAWLQTIRWSNTARAYWEVGFRLLFVGLAYWAFHRLLR